jgi:hypothetical protein
MDGIAVHHKDKEQQLKPFLKLVWEDTSPPTWGPLYASAGFFLIVLV